MAKTPISELLSTFRIYSQKLSDGERTPSELASALTDWAHESAESVRSKIHDEVESAVLKMGFVKREEFDALALEVAALKRRSAPKKSAVSTSSPKRVASKARVKRAVKR